MSAIDRYAKHLRAYRRVLDAWKSGSAYDEQLNCLFDSAVTFDAEGFEVVFAYTPLRIMGSVHGLFFDPGKLPSLDHFSEKFNMAGFRILLDADAYMDRFNELAALVDDENFQQIMMLEKLSYRGAA